MNYSISELILTPMTTQRVAAMDARCFPYDAPTAFEDTAWWIATDQDGVDAAYLGLFLKMDEAIGYVSRVGVLEPHRGNGLQCRLLRTAEKAARRRGLAQIITYTLPQNVASSNSFIKTGYRLHVPWHSFWAGEDALYWYKDLTV
jgi:GNAT superfamily N-acetyltransferase